MSLNSRVTQLEISVGNTFHHQLQNLQTRANAAIDQYRQLQRVLALHQQLNIENTVDSANGIQLDPTPLAEKRQLVMAKRTEIIDAYNNLLELGQFDFNSLVQFANHDYAEDVNALSQRKDAILKVTEVYYQLQTKNVLLLERYTAFIIRVNRFWLSIDSQLKNLGH